MCLNFSPVISKSARIWHPSAIPVLLKIDTAILFARVAFSQRPGMLITVYGMYQTKNRIPPAAAPEFAERTHENLHFKIPDKIKHGGHQISVITNY